MVLQAVRSANIAKLVEEDVSLFNGILRDIFPDTEEDETVRGAGVLFFN